MKLHTLIHFCSGRIRAFGRSESGMTLPLLGISMVMLIGFVGISIDVGRMQMVQSKLQFSLDAAGLAAGSTASTADLNTEVSKYLYANFNGYLGATVTNIGISPNAQTTIISLNATATLPTTFMQVLGVNTITVNANSQVSRQITGLEVTLVVDVSYGDGLANFEAGLSNFVQTLFKSAAGVSGNLYMSVIPFNHTVNIGTGNATWLTPSSVTANNASGWGPQGSWAGCVMARTGSENIVDDPPAGGNTLFGQYYYASDTASSLSFKHGISLAAATTDFNQGPTEWQTLNAAQQTDNQNSMAFFYDLGVNLWQGSVSGTQKYASPLNSNQQGPNFMCPPPLVPLTNNQTSILNAINSVTVVQGDWLPDMGLEWGWNTISPRWAGVWSGVAGGLPHPYNTKGWNKAVVWVEGYSTLSMPQTPSNGLNWNWGNTIDNEIYGGYGYLNQDGLGSTNYYTATNTVFNNAEAICNSLKADNVYIYILGYSPNGSSTGLVPAQQYCATAQNYTFWFGPNDWSAFNTALNSIADALNNLWLSE
jgi:Flp pilus assembly protein TadG